MRNYTPLPNMIFSLGLSPGELSVYVYLLYCENRKTYQCWPGYRTIGEAVGLSVNTVRKHICALTDRSLISTENTSVMTRDGMKRNGTLKYTILPIPEVVEYRSKTAAVQTKKDAAANKCPTQNESWRNRALQSSVSRDKVVTK